MLLVGAVETVAELAALEALLEARAILFLAVRLLACAESKAHKLGVPGVNALEVVQVSAVLLLD